MKSILLINTQNSDQIRAPGYYLMPLSLLYLSGTSKLYAETHILDLNVAKMKYFHASNEDEKFSYVKAVKDEVEKLKPDFVGISCLFSAQFEMVLHIADAVKEANSSSFTILGGMHPTIYYKDILENCPNVNSVIIGEGEKTLEQILTLDMNKWKEVKGLAFKDKQNQLHINTDIPFVEDLDKMPSPAYELFDFKDYKLDSSGWYNPKKLDIGTSVPILTSRSCPFKCSFCAMNLIMGTRFRARSAEHVFKEIEFLYKEFGVRYFNIIDDNFTLDKTRVIKLCKYIIESKMEISFDACNGIMPSTLDDEVIDLLAEAGYAYSFLAIESGSDYIRNQVMNKHLSLDTIRRVIKSFRRYPQIHLAAFFLMGMPEETRETLDETYQLIEELDLDDFKVAVATPFPGTKLFDQCLRDDLFLTDKETLDSLWCNSNWYLHILNKDPKFFYKPYALEVAELQEYIRKFEYLRYQKHLLTEKKGRLTMSVSQSIIDYRKRNPGVE